MYVGSSITTVDSFKIYIKKRVRNCCSQHLTWLPKKWPLLEVFVGKIRSCEVGLSFSFSKNTHYYSLSASYKAMLLFSEPLSSSARAAVFTIWQLRFFLFLEKSEGKYLMVA